MIPRQIILFELRVSVMSSGKESAGLQKPTAPALHRAETDGQANEQLLYFTTASLTSDDRVLAVLTDRFAGGGTNLAHVDRLTGDIEPLTGISGRGLACYPCFDCEDRGLNKSSPSLHPGIGDLYFVEGQGGGRSRVGCVNVHTGQGRMLAELPPGVSCAYTHISADNRRLLLPLTDEKVVAFARTRTRNDEISQFFRREALVTTLFEIDTVTGSGRVLWEEPDWVTHVQYHPTDFDCILFNHEWTWPLGLQRMWLRESPARGPRRLRDVGRLAGRRYTTAHDGVSHEVWMADGTSIIYHGETGVGRGFVGRLVCGRDSMVEVELPAELCASYGHFMPSPSGRAVATDSLALVPGQDRSSQQISLLDVDWDACTMTVRHLGENGSSWRTQDDHPHPVFAGDGRTIFYTSDRSGKRAVYSVLLDGE